MVCEAEAVQDIAAVLGVDTTHVPAPKWTESVHVYECSYLYAGGARMTLSVKELSSEAETTNYFETLANELGRADTLHDIGGDGYTTRDNSVVVRKDYKVLLVDTSKLPASFGKPPQTPRQVAVSVASTIMGCWTGA